MNQRIRLLADEADKWSQTMTWSSDPKYGDRPVSDLFNEKFAELIVRECIEICRSEDWEDQQGWGKFYAHQIKKKFEAK